jgi:hypothetical protein
MNWMTCTSCSRIWRIQFSAPAAELGRAKRALVKHCRTSHNSPGVGSAFKFEPELDLDQKLHLRIAERPHVVKA